MYVIKKVLLSLIGLVVVAAVGLFAFVYINKSPQVFEPSVAGLYQTESRAIDATSKRSTASGEVIGFADSYNTQAWLGIPYAEPPVGELRWKAPRPAVNWQGVREATDYGSACVQYWGLLAGEEGNSGDLLGDEDCLSLNIWAPSQSGHSQGEPNNTEKLPVMVWIHGGGNDSGTGKVYQAHHLAGKQKVVVVTINYRVGLMGWFSHDAVRDTSNNLADASGNFGTLDIIQALKWVKANIGEFGGDASNVTIFGESAGGRNVYSMVASPLAKGLFHRAIVQSGTPDTTLQTLAENFPDETSSQPQSGLKNSSNSILALVLKQQNPTLANERVRALVENTSAPELMKMMRNVDAKQLMQLASDNIGQLGYTKIARVIRDGHVIPKESLLELFKDPARYNSVPLMLGSNRDEQKVFMARNPKYVSNLLGVLPRIKDQAQYARVNEYVSNNWKAGSVDEPARIISSSNGAPVYTYRFDWDEEPSNFLVDLSTLLGAAHGFEISFVFGDFIGGIPVEIIYDKSNANGRKELALTMMDYWAEFARTGNPASGTNGLRSNWNAWQASGSNVMLLDSNADGGARMAEARDYVADIKAMIPQDEVIVDVRERCEAYATLFLHGYQSSDFWDPTEYSEMGCSAFPALEFRNS